MFGDGSNAIRDGRSISPRHPLPGSMRSRASSRPLPSGGSRAASFAPSPTYKPRSTVSSRSTISNQTLHLDRRPRQNHRRGQARAPSVRFGPLVRMDMAEFLRECGYRLYEAATAKEAIEALQAKFAVDLVFTDINLRDDMNG